MSTTPDEPELAPLPREEWRLEVDRQAAEKREENQRRGDEEQDPSLGAVDLDVIDASLRSTSDDLIADDRLLRLREALRSFGFHLYGLDMRQNSDTHEATIAELFAWAGVHDDYASLDEDEDQAPAAQPKAETGAQGRSPLDTIAADIARMIDHATAVDLWQRYRQGEADLFTPKLYTAQGRQTFGEIQRRYRADAEFRKTVDRYVNEFERLLGEVSRNDRDSRRADAYLTSETGKVYTMLAHASGRFEGI